MEKARPHTAPEALERCVASEFLASCLAKAGFDTELCGDVTDACEVAELNALDLASGDLSAEEVANRLFLVDTEARCVCVSAQMMTHTQTGLAVCAARCGAACITPARLARNLTLHQRSAHHSQTLHLTTLHCAHTACLSRKLVKVCGRLCAREGVDFGTGVGDGESSEEGECHASSALAVPSAHACADCVVRVDSPAHSAHVRVSTLSASVSRIQLNFLQ